MTAIQAAVLGILQGLTEFLPISSSGHLCLAQKLLGLNSPALVSFDIALHFASLLAILILLRASILQLLTRRRKLFSFLFLATLPTIVVGLKWGSALKALFNQPIIVAAALMGTGLLLLLAEGLSRPALKSEKQGILRSLAIGLGQACAMVPGISRSGTTICVAMLCGIKREDAFEFSFLMAIPAILGASGYELLHHGSGGSALQWTPLAVGFVASFLFSLLGFVWLKKILLAGRLKWLGIYCLLIGISSLVFLVQKTG